VPEPHPELRPENPQMPPNRPGGHHLGHRHDGDGVPRTVLLGAAAALATAAAVPLAWRAVTGEWPAASAHAGPVRVRTALTVHRSLDDVYERWRRLDRLPSFMRHVEEVRVHDERRSTWVATGPTGKTVCWEAEITEDRPGELLAWRSLPGSEVEQSGRVGFREEPHGRGTRIEVDISLAAPYGRVGRAVAALLQPATERQIREDVRRFKQLVEAGEVATVDGQPHGERSRIDPSNPF
jgi:uncharacterized membrane protein